MKVNTRLYCSVITATCAVLAIGLPNLDPSNFWLALAGLVLGAIAAGSGTVVAFYDKLVTQITNKTQE